MPNNLHFTIQNAVLTHGRQHYLSFWNISRLIIVVFWSETSHKAEVCLFVQTSVHANGTRTWDFLMIYFLSLIWGNSVVQMSVSMTENKGGKEWEDLLFLIRNRNRKSERVDASDWTADRWNIPKTFHGGEHVQGPGLREYELNRIFFFFFS